MIRLFIGKEYELKKKLILFLTLIGILSVCLLLCSCGKNSKTIVHTVYTVGTYSGYRVDCVRFERKNEGYNEVEVEYYVDDVYISTFPNPTYNYLVYTSESDYVILKNASCTKPTRRF